MYLATGVLSAALPDPGEPEIVALGGTLGGFFGAIFGLTTGGRNREEIYWSAFIGGIAGTGIALVLYLLISVRGLY